MPRHPRVEFEGGLYHVLSRGNNRQSIFQTDEDRRKLLRLLVREKDKRPFYLYAYVLMTNHFHLLLEQRADRLSGIMQRLLTAYAQYWNRKYRRVGHLFQSRYKAFLCQKDSYLVELVRYIHLNPVRAKMVRRAEAYPWSSHRAYLGIEPCGWVDSESVLRYFGATRSRAVKVYRAFVNAGIQQGHREDLYEVAEGQFLGTEEFIDEIKHRIGETPTSAQRPILDSWDWERVEHRVAYVLGLESSKYSNRGLTAAEVEARDLLIYVGRLRSGFSNRDLAQRLGIHPCNVSRGYDRARERLRSDNGFRQMVERVFNEE